MGNNAIPDGLAEGRVGWAFWPPDTPLENISTHTSPEQGLWIPRGDIIEDDDHRDDMTEAGSESDDDRGAHDAGRVAFASEEEEAGESDYSEGFGSPVTLKTTSRFGALAIGSDSDSSENEED